MNVKYVNFAREFTWAFDPHNSLTATQVQELLERYGMCMTLVERGDTDNGMVLLEDFGFLFDLGGKADDFAIIRIVLLGCAENDGEHHPYSKGVAWHRATLVRSAADILADDFAPGSDLDPDDDE